MRGDLADDGGECADPQACMIRDSQMMLAALLRRQPHVASGLARHDVAVVGRTLARSRPERSRDDLTRYAAMTSS